MAKKRITDITVERTALLTTDYIAGDSTSGTNNTGKISFPNLLAQLSGGPTTPTFQVKLSTLATAGLGGVSRLARGFDIFGTNPKATTAAVENLLQVASNDAASPLALRFGVTTHATATSRNGIIEVDDGGTKRNLLLQPTGGNVGIGSITGAGYLLEIGGTMRVSGLLTADGGIQLNSGDIIGADNGTALLPVYTFTDDKDTGMWRPQANFLSFSTGGVERLRIDSAGNIGIGQITFGSSAAKVLALANGTIPGTLADAFQMVSADIVAGNAAPHFVTEAGPVIRLYQQAGIADADGTLASATTKINAVLQVLENLRLTAIA